VSAGAKSACHSGVMAMLIRMETRF